MASLSNSSSHDWCSSSRHFRCSCCRRRISSHGSRTMGAGGGGLGGTKARRVLAARGFGGRSGSMKPPPDPSCPFQRSLTSCAFSPNPLSLCAGKPSPESERGLPKNVREVREGPGVPDRSDGGAGGNCPDRQAQAAGNYRCSSRRNTQRRTSSPGTYQSRFGTLWKPRDS